MSYYRVRLGFVAPCCGLAEPAMEEYADIIVIIGYDFLNRYRRLELNDRPGRFALVYGDEPTH